MQLLIVASAAGLSALYFLRGAFLDLGGKGERAPACGKCSSGGCPAARQR